MSKAVEFLLAVLVLQHVTALGLAQDVYQCQISADQGGLVYTPNIPDAHFTEESAAQASAGVIPTLVKASNRVTYFFTLPPLSPERNCNGTVMAIQFCYHAELKNIEFGVLRDIFEFLVTDRRDQLITINSRFHVEAASSATNCVVGRKSGMNTLHDCCTLFHPPNELLIPTSSFTFGIRILSDMDFTPFIFDHRVQEFRAEQFQTAATGDSFTLGNSLTNHALFLLRFLLEPPTTSIYIPSTAAPSTAAPSTASPSTTAPSTPLTAAPSTAAPSTASPSTTAPSTPLTAAPSTAAPSTAAPSTAAPSTAAPSTAAPSTAAPSTAAPSTTMTMPVTIPTQQTTATTSSPIASEGVSVTMDQSSGNTPPPPTAATPTTGNGTGVDNSLSSGSSTGVAVGGVVGGVIVGLLIGVAVIALLVGLAVGRYRKYQSKDKQKGDTAAMENAGYGEFPEPEYDSYYAGIGPQVTTATATLKSQDASDCYYAECGAEIPKAALAYEEPTEFKVDLGNPVYEKDSGPVSWKDEDIYMVPAMDEDLLYAQLQDMLTLNLARESVKLSALLGSGQFGTVYKGVLDSKDGEVDVAVKTLKEGSAEDDRVKFLQEAAIMGQFKHHNVVTIYGVVTRGEPILLVLELLSNGDLREYLMKMRSNEGTPDDHTLLSYCRQVASGMAYLSSKAFVHRDLAARNILVSDDEICKIADFGMSRDLQENYYVSHGGKIPVKWTAPEALYYKKYSTASDVWSYGILVYEIWSLGLKPYGNCANNKVIKLVDTGYRLPPPPGCPRALYKIMMSCWHPKTSGRPSFQDLTRQLSLPDTKLLKWAEEDKSVHPEAAQLGGDLLCGEELYKDLQIWYKQK